MMHRLPRFALRGISLLALVFTLYAVPAAQPQQQQPSQLAQPLGALNYKLAMTRPLSHLFEVSIEVKMGEGPSPEYLYFQMPRWSPGRYAVFDFAKNVQDFDVSIRLQSPDGSINDKPWHFKRVDDQTWRVMAVAPGGVMVVKYKVFGDDLSGTFSQLDERHATINGGSVLMYLVDHKQDSVRLTIEPPSNWRVVNAWTSNVGQREWQFPNYDIMIDTPTEVAPDWTLDEFKVEGKSYRVMVHSFGDEGGKRPALVRDIEKIVRAETAMWGTPEFESYTFLLHFAADDRSSDGMEHLNSTQIVEPGALADAGIYEDTLDAVAHEFFHVWNVKRLRPVELGPWDFTRPANTRSLWIAEGITNYYGHLMQRRAGIWDDQRFLQELAQNISGVENAPGSRLTSAEESSLTAPFQDNAVHAQKINLGNTSVSYYPKGEVVGLVLDLLIRGKTGGRASLDEVMRQMYREFYLNSPNASYYLRGRGYETKDFERVATQVAGTDLDQFFLRYSHSIEPPPYDEAFAQVGLRLVREPAREGYTAGITLDFADAGSARIGNVRNDSPAENAGLRQGDVLLKIGNAGVTRETWLAVLNRYKANERVPVTLKRDRQTIKATLNLGPPEHYDYRIEELKDASPAARALRTAWLKG
ncbi:MAG TPA: PDZ domain-containing protein [Pyrinomonadaceae bacterium]|nr:PDZ domain-containing protein [Pyrinomonadaceae bacterium]